jgi:phosphomannomutase
MPLIKSISGIRGTVGDDNDENLSPANIKKFVISYCKWIFSINNKSNKLTIVTGRDGRESGPEIHKLVNETIISRGIDVLDLGLSTTPSVGFSVPRTKSQGGIIITASHNPKEWNALKLLNENGEFISKEAGKLIVNNVNNVDLKIFKSIRVGNINSKYGYYKYHIDEILNISFLKLDKIKSRKIKVVVDGINSTGGLAVPYLLEKLNINCVKLNCIPDGNFAHNPEPLKENLNKLCEKVKLNSADFGIAVDPDVDRLVFVDEKGEVFGEEYTLVACADYILKNTPGSTVSNLSSTRALSDITKKYGEKYYSSSVGEVNVVKKMKEINAVIGGEGNGGVIYPKTHYGRDALIGIVFFISHLVDNNISVSELKELYPQYYMSKSKIELSKNIKIQDVLKKIETLYKNEKINKEDGLKIDFSDSWAHIRKSNTEMIIRIYTEAKTFVQAENLSKKIVKEIKESL